MKKFCWILCAVLALMLGVFATACREKADAELVTCTVSEEVEVAYNATANTSTVKVFVKIDNKGKVPVKALTLKCLFLDGEGNEVDRKLDTFSVNGKANAETDYAAVFERIQGKPERIMAMETEFAFGEAPKTKVGELLWLIVLGVVVYIGLGVLIAYACYQFLCDDSFVGWLWTVLCGIFWPVGGIILLIAWLGDNYC